MAKHFDTNTFINNLRTLYEFVWRKINKIEKVKWPNISIQTLINELRTLYESLYGENEQN